MTELHKFIASLKAQGLSEAKIPMDVWVGIINYFADKELTEQCNIDSVSVSLTDKTPINDWDKLSQCSTRLNNVLKGNYYARDENSMKYIEDINEKGFMRLRCAGRKSWLEFTTLRGY